METPSSGEEFLIRNGLVGHRGRQRRQILGCVACQWANSAEGSQPGAYGYKVMFCRNVPSGAVYPRLDQLEEAGVATSETVPTDAGTMRRYSPAETELGQAFAEALTTDIPQDCSERTNG